MGETVATTQLQPVDQGEITCTIVEREQDPDWPTLNLIWLDILYPGIKSVRLSMQSFFSHQIANSPFVPRTDLEALAKKTSYLSMLSPILQQ